MARIEEDKEDLIRDALALHERVELSCDNWPAVITIGFFRDGRCSIYIDQDPFYQFDRNGRLRRCFEAGLLYRSQGHTLSCLKRHRIPSTEEHPREVRLQRRDLTPEELNGFRERMRRHIGRLQGCLSRNAFRISRGVTQAGTLPKGTLDMLNRILQRQDDFLAAAPAPR